MVTVTTPDPGDSLFVWPWDTIKNDHLSRGEIQEIADALTGWLRTTAVEPEMAIAREAVQVNGPDRFIHAIKDARQALGEAGLRSDLHYVKDLISKVRAEKGWK